MTITAPRELVDLSHLQGLEVRQDSTHEPLRDELFGLIEQQIAEHPRTLQTEIGPSEIGTPCARKLMYALAGVPVCSRRGAPWLPTIGTAVHDWLAEAVLAQNRRSGWTRYIVETRINAGRINGYGELEGSLDVYDRLTASIIDWKIVGDSKLKEYRTRPRAEYRVQPHVYGAGIIARGLPVQRVMLMFLPRNKDRVRDGVAWSEPYDETVAPRAIARAERVNTLRLALGFQRAATVTNDELISAGAEKLADPDVFMASGSGARPDDPAVPIADDCRFCPWLRTGGDPLNLPRGGPGVDPAAMAVSAPSPEQVMSGGGRQPGH